MTREAWKAILVKIRDSELVSDPFSPRAQSAYDLLALLELLWLGPMTL
jgi:hypothetical protein